MDKEFSGGGGEGDFGGFTLGAQALVERFQDGVVLGGDEGGHPQPGAHGGPSAGDVALAAMEATVVIARGQTGQGSGLGFVEGAEFGQLGQKQGGGSHSD